MAKPMNMERRIRELETAKPAKVRNPVAYAMIFQTRCSRHVDQKKERARRACRGANRRDLW